MSRDASDAASISEKLGAFIAATASADIGPEVRETARLCLLHDLLIGLAGRPYETAIQAFARTAWALPPQATMLSSGARVAAEAAAFANAALMNVRSQDDTHEGSITHPGVPVIAAALAAAELSGASGADLVTAVVLGYETTARIGRPCAAVLSKKGLRPAAMLGIFGATAAAAKLLRLDGAQIAHALGLATQMAGGHSQVWVEGGSEFTTQLGMCARNGLTAARLAQAGVTASRHSFEGKSGFYRAQTALDVAVEDVAGGFGGKWAVSEVTLKPSPVCAALQGPVTLLASLAARHGIEHDAVEQIVLTLNPFEAGFPGIDNPGPIATPAAAKMSAQFSLGLALRDGHVGFRELAMVEDPVANGLAARVRVASDPGVPARQCRLAVTLRDGRRIDGAIEVPVGRPERDGILATAMQLRGESGAGAEAISGMADAVLGLDEATDLHNLFVAWRQAIGVPRTVGRPA